MSPPNTYYLLCREIIFLWRDRRQADTERGGKLTPRCTVLAWSFQTKLRSWNYFIIGGSLEEVQSWSQRLPFPEPGCAPGIWVPSLLQAQASLFTFLFESRQQSGSKGTHFLCHCLWSLSCDSWAFPSKWHAGFQPGKILFSVDF